MNLTIPAELERAMYELQAQLAQAMSDLERLKTRRVLVRAALSHHKHDWARDVTSPPTTYTPATHTHPAYAPAEHTHPDKASSTHVHNYQDGQYTLKPEQNVDVARTTGGPV